MNCLPGLHPVQHGEGHRLGLLLPTLRLVHSHGVVVGRGVVVRGRLVGQDLVRVRPGPGGPGRRPLLPGAVR